MAGSSSTFVPLHTSLSHNVKVLRVANKLGVKRPQVIGHLCLLWAWTIQNRKDGVIEGISNWEIAHFSEWEGSSDQFVEALIDHELLDTEPLRIHDWDEYGGKMLRSRETDRFRKQVQRERDSAQDQRFFDGHEDVRVTSAGHPAMSRSTPTLTPRRTLTETLTPTSTTSARGRRWEDVSQYEEVLGEQRLTTMTRKALALSPQLDRDWLEQALREAHNLYGDKPESELSIKIKQWGEAITRSLTLPPGHKNTILAPKPYAKTVLLTTIKGER